MFISSTYKSFWLSFSFLKSVKRLSNVTICHTLDRFHNFLLELSLSTSIILEVWMEKKVLSHSFAAFHKKTQIFFWSFHEKKKDFFFYSWNWKKFWVCLLFASDSTFPSSSTYVCNLNWDNRSLECHDFNVKLANRSLSKIILTPQCHFFKMSSLKTSSHYKTAWKLVFRNLYILYLWTFAHLLSMNYFLRYIVFF